MWNKAANWVLAHFTAPPAFNRAEAIAIVAALILGIGLIDSLAGIHISFAVFYFIPLVLSVAWLGSKSGTIVSFSIVIVRLVGDYAAVGFHTVPLWTVWNSLSALIIFLFFTWVLNELFALQRGLELRVADRTAELLEAARSRRKLELELLAVGSRERNAIGHELHDDICQHLVGTAMAAQVLAQGLATRESALAADAQAIVGWVEAGADKTRKLARGLLLAEIEPGKLGESLAELTAEANDGVICRFRQEGDTTVADAGTAAQLFRIGQEALRNALKHAGARHVDISLTGDSQSVRVLVEDDGCGVITPREGSMGIRIMSNRAQYLGGELLIEAIPGKGTRVTCRLPRTMA